MLETLIPLRLHHLANIQDAMNQGMGKYFTHFETEISLDGRSRKRGSNPFVVFTDYDYYKDTVGPSTRKNQFLQLNQEVFDRYLELDNDTTLDLIPKGKDLICDTCFVGTHCLNTFHYVGEASLATRLQESIIKNNLVGQFEVLGNIKLRNFHVLTTMGLIRTILNLEPKMFSY